MALFLTPNTKFKPFSYQEMLAPVLAYKEAYDAADAELNTLLEDAATKGFDFAPQDVAEKEAYDNMMSKLRQASDDLSSGNVNAFKDIRNLNKEYRKTMIPIQQKIAKRAELAAEQRKYTSLNSDLRFSTDYSKASLSDITTSSTYDIYDLNDITKDVKEEMSKFIKGVPRTDFEPVPIGKTSNVLVKTGYGYDATEFDEQMQDTNSALYKLYESKVANLNPNMPDEIKQEAAKEIYNTMKANAGSFKFDTVIDYSTKPSGNTGNKRDKKPKPEIYGEVKTGDKFVSLTYNGKMMTAELEWSKNDKGEEVYRIKPETIRGISSGSKKLTDEELQFVRQTYKDDEGNVIKIVETQRGPESAFNNNDKQLSDSTSVAGSVGSKGFKSRKQ